MPTATLPSNAPEAKRHLRSRGDAQYFRARNPNFKPVVTEAQRIGQLCHQGPGRSYYVKHMSDVELHKLVECGGDGLLDGQQKARVARYHVQP